MKPGADIDPLADLPWPTPKAPSGEVSAAICGQCTHKLKPQRGLKSWQRLVLSVILSLSVFGTLAWLTRGRARFEGTFHNALVGAAGWGIVLAAVMWAGLARPPGRRVSTRIRLVMAVLLPVGFLMYVVHAAPEWVSFAEFSHGARAAHAIGCSLVGLVFSAIVSGGVLLLWRGTDPLSPSLSGALVGLVGGVGGSLAIGVGCASQEGWHSSFAHGLGVIAFTLLGWGVGRRLLSP
ncbi:MAG TPA: NrsF family protein [Polyangiaceae bacterium]|nr:NrsF family protein [Polyangiaceae bacterium]